MKKKKLFIITIQKWLVHTDLLPNYVDPMERDVISYYVQGSGGAKRSYIYLKRPEMPLQNNKANQPLS